MGSRTSKSVHDGCTGGPHRFGVHSGIHGPVIFFQNRVGQQFFIRPFSPQVDRIFAAGSFDTVLCMDESFFFLVLQRRAVFQSTLVRGSPASVYPGSTYSTGVTHWDMYDILAPRANSFQQRPRYSDVPDTQFLVLSSPCHLYYPYSL